MIDPKTLPAEPARVSQPAPSDRDRQRAFLLNLLAAAPGKKLPRGQVTRKLKTKAAEAAGLGRSGSLEGFHSLESDGLVRLVKANRTVVYELTDAGVARLAEVRDLLPVKPGRGGIRSPANEQVRNYRTAYLLLQVLRGSKSTITEAEANKGLDSYAREGLELNVATASRLRRDLVAGGLLAVDGSGRGAIYSLTAEGRLALGNARFEDGRDFRIPGEVLNRLLEAAREVGKQFLAATPTPVRSPAREELEQVIRGTFAELLRERYAVSGLVPIAEVRATVRDRLGESAARHDVFDEVVLQLWRARKIGLVPITNPSKATPDQLRDAIRGEGDTLFYLETAHEPASV